MKLLARMRMLIVMQILTNAHVIRQATHVNIGYTFLLQLRIQRGIRQFFVVPKHRVRINFRICTFVHLYRTVNNLKRMRRFGEQQDANVKVSTKGIQLVANSISLEIKFIALLVG